jgi:hypothetical protein
MSEGLRLTIDSESEGVSQVLIPHFRLLVQIRKVSHRC